MERVRRRKMCCYLVKGKRYKGFSGTKEKPVERENDVTCSNDDEISHPYEGHINFVHAISDVLNAFAGLSAKMVSCAPRSDNNTDMHQRCLGQCRIYNILAIEAYYADKKKLWCGCTAYVPLVSQIEDRNRKVPVCGNYIDNAHRLAETAALCIERSKNRQEAKIHEKKLKFFQAFKEMQKIKRAFFYI